MKSSIKDFSSKCDQIRRKVRIWSHLLKKSLMQNFIFREVLFEMLNQYKAEAAAIFIYGFNWFESYTKVSLRDLSHSLTIVNLHY